MLSTKSGTMKTLCFLICKKSNWEVSWDKNTRPLVDQFLCQSVFVSTNFYVNHFFPADYGIA